MIRLDKASESGSNANGRWWKFANGLMICTNTIWKRYNSVAAGSIGYVEFEEFWTFPQPFAEAPKVTVSVERGGAQAWLGSIGVDVDKASYAFVYTQYPLSDVASNFSCVAIGRWK